MLFRGRIGLRSEVESLPLFGLAFLLNFAQLCGFFFAAAGQAPFLELQIAELLLVSDEGLKLDHVRAERGFMLFESLSKLEVTLSENGHLQSGNAVEAPSGIGDRENQIGLDLTDGLKLLHVGVDVALVFGGVV